MEVRGIGVASAITSAKGNLARNILNDRISTFINGVLAKKYKW